MKFFTHHLFLLIALILPFSSWAQLPPETNWGPPHTVNAVSNPGYLETVYDAAHNVNVTRISDEVVFGGSGGDIQHQYSKVQAWNSDMTYLWLGWDRLLDGNNYQLLKTFSNHMNDGRWANTEPNIRYYGDKKFLKKIDVVTGEITVLHEFPDFDREITIGPWEGNLSADDKYVVVTDEDEGADFAYHAALFDLETNTVLASKYFPDKFDWASITPWGDYIVVNNIGTGNTEIYDLEFNFIKILSDRRAHADFAIDMEGNRVLVEMCPIGMVRLDNLEQTDLLPLTEYTCCTCGTQNPSHDNPWICGHVSGRNFDLPGWVLISAGSDKCNNGFNAYYNRTEIFLLKLDGSGTIRHLGYTRSTYKSYTAQAKASVSRDGTRAIFTSDWNIDGYGTDKARDYIVQYNTGKTFNLTTEVVAGEGAINPPEGQFADGSTATIKAEPALGYSFGSWGGDASGSENPLTIVMDTNKHISASFIETTTYTLDINISGHGTVKLSPEGGVYNEGVVVTINPYPENGYRFDSWSGDLTGTENPATITMDGNKSVTVTFSENDALIAYWPLSETSGTLLTDFTGHNNDATLNNSDDATYVEGMLSGAIYFNKSRDGNIVSAPALQPKSLTVAAYVKADPANTDWQWVAAMGDNYGLYITDEGKAELYYFDGSDWPFAVSEAIINDNSWHHIAGTFDNTTKKMKVYVDGKQDAEAIVNRPIQYTLGNDFHIGSMQGSRNFLGAIDELRVYNEALDESEIKKLLVSGSQNTLTLNAENGRISAFPFREGYNEGSVVTLTAIANEDYEFDNWSNDLSGSENPAELIMDADKEVTANFREASSVYELNDFNTNLKASPNPFTNHVLISYELNKRTDVKLSIFDVYGNLVQILVNQNQRPGNHQIEWSGNDRPAGIYFCRLKYENKIKHTRMLLIK